MKTLKIKLGLLSLLAILAVSVFLTSCEQEAVLQETTLTQEEIVAKMQNDADVADLLSKTDEIRTAFLEKATESNVTAEDMMKSMEDGTFTEMLETIGLNADEYQQSMDEIQRLSHAVLNKYPSIETCQSCGNISSAEQLETFQTVLDGAYLRGDCSNWWSWQYAKYAACVATCAITTSGWGYFACSFVCYLSFCTDN